MPFISFNKSTEPAAPDDLRINTASILYVEASPPDLVGRTLIHMLGQGSTVNAVTESIGTVVSTIGGLVGMRRHYLAPPPDEGVGTVFVQTANISYIRPNLPLSPEFWYLKFVDGSELRVADPLPSGL